MIKISVIVPVYNPGKKLKNCIESILRQTFNNFELILVNDGSTDNSLEICKYYKSKDNRVRVINKTNEGSIKARKTGLENSVGDYIAYIDADDYIHKDYLLKLSDRVLEDDIDVSVCNISKVLDSYNFIKKDNKSYYHNEEKIYVASEIRDYIVPAYLHGHPFSSSLYAKLYKKEFLLSSGKFLKNIKFLGDDLFLNLEVFLKVKKVKIIKEALYYYRLGGFTNRYMPYHFNDIVEGYKVQKYVINNYTFKANHNVGISIMLLNSFNCYLLTLLNSQKNKIEIQKIIKESIENDCLQEAIRNERVKKYFGEVYSNNLLNKNIDYFYDLVYKKYFQKKIKNILKNLLFRILS